MRSSLKIENSNNLRGIFQFFGVLTVLMSLAAVAQIRGAGPVYAKAQAVSALPGADNGGHVSGIGVQTVASVTHPDTPVQRVGMVESYGRVPLAFEANQGQADPQVKFVSRGAGYNLFLTDTEAVLTLQRASRREPNSPRTRAQPQKEKPAVLHMKLVGANTTTTEVSGKDELSGKSNYFIGNDPKKWRTNVRQYARVRYANLYPGVDLVYYGNQRELEYDFVLQPGASPDAIRLGIEGASKIRLDQGDLVLSSPGGDVRLRHPYTYQEVNGTKRDIRSHYVMNNKNEVGFRVAAYDRSRALIIDPVLAYSTYLGGSADDAAYDIAVDSAGNAYVTGVTTSADFPTADAFQPAYGGNADAFVTKINADGSALVYSTYLGGSSDEVGQSIAVDSAGSAYVTGYTGSPDFPTVNPIQATNHGIHDAFVTKISPDGSALIYSTYLGGSSDDYGWGIAVDSAGNAHVTGDTPSRDFPVFKALQPTFHEGANFNSFVSEINADGSALIYSTYWGGSGGEGGSRVAVDPAGNSYIGGYTFSPDFPTVNAIQPTYAGNVDAYLTKLSADGQKVIYSTFLGGSGFEYGWDVAVDSAGNAYMTGFTQSTDFPTAHALQPTNHGNTDAFVAKINASGNAFVFSTYLGGGATDLGTSIAADSSGNAYVGGYTKSKNFPTVNAIQPTNHGGFDAFVAKISGDGSALLYSTYLGGSANESIFDAGYRDLGIAVDSAGSAYVAGTTKSVDFPITPQAFQKSLKGGADAFVAKIAPGSLTTLTSSLNPSIYGQKVTFTATVAPSGSITPTGRVKFTWSIYNLGSATLNTNGVATLTKSNLNADFYPLTAAYGGDANNPPSTSAVLNQVVLETTSAATLTSSPNPSTQGQAVTFTATISSPTVIPTGPVTFTSGKTVLGTAQLSGGKAKLVISSLPVGSTKVTVTYYGDSNIAKSSASVTQTMR
jgi:Big-like domain-containing protein/beta-propeller repeat-containing protein